MASTNPGKVAELSAMLDADVDWVGLDAFEDLEEVVENGATFTENARKKAVGYSKQTGLWTIAD
ncbi:MAG: non-canonical purine NTP pyrophosphatase [Planctomycetes bacterium]|nr:non-canonical purine NTP pyrophosphatase [Planctomycetota bacterium]